MSRQEDFIDAGIAYRMEHGKPMAIGGGNLAEMAKEMNRTKPFEAGAEYGYQYAVDKACEWLENNLSESQPNDYGEIDVCLWFYDKVAEVIDGFRKAMEGD